jgi:hypothetical protein
MTPGARVIALTVGYNHPRGIWGTVGHPKPGVRDLFPVLWDNGAESIEMEFTVGPWGLAGRAERPRPPGCRGVCRGSP